MYPFISLQTVWTLRKVAFEIRDEFGTITTIVKNFLIFVIVPIFLFAHASQNIFPNREDFPLSRWGMYKHLKSGGQYDKVAISFTHRGEGQDFFRLIGGESFVVDDMIRFQVLGKSRREYITEGLKNYDISSRDENIKRVVKDHIAPQLKRRGLLDESTHLVIRLMKWSNLNRNNIFDPEDEEILFSGAVLE